MYTLTRPARPRVSPGIASGAAGARAHPLLALSGGAGRAGRRGGARGWPSGAGGGAGGGGGAAGSQHNGCYKWRGGGRGGVAGVRGSRGEERAIEGGEGAALAD